jgi:amino acid adenylation domain-containing protein
MTTVLRLDGALSVDALQRTVDEIVRRHESLRTTFPVRGDGPVQQVAPPAGFPLAAVDLSDRDPDERERALGDLLRREGGRPFDLACGPLLRVGLIRLGRSEHVISLTLHHIIADGWSMGVLVREVAVLYGAFLRGETSPLPELEVQYADYAEWQHGPEQAGRVDALRDYWCRKMAGVPVLELAADRPRPAQPSPFGAHLLFTLPGELAGAIKRLAAAQDATPFMVLLAAFKSLLLRYTGQTDLCVGTPVANRTRPELEPLIGFFVNTLALRTDLAGDPTFAEALKQVRTTALEAYAHQEFPFERLIEEVDIARELGNSPLLPVMFVLQNAGGPDFEMPEVRVSPVPFEAGTSAFDLTLMLGESGSGMSGVFEYRTDLFEEATIRRMAKHFERLLAAAVAAPWRKISELPLLSQLERRQVLSDWNETVADYPRHRSVHALFEDQARRMPDAVAVAIGPDRLTYHELNARADRLARSLRRRGVGPEVLVGIRIEPSLDQIVGVWAILKAGGAYVPIDPGYPPGQLAELIGDARIRVLLTHSALGGGPLPGDVAIVHIDEPAADPPESVPSGAAVVPENLVYAIHTSGSTGRPKAVLIAHRGLVNSTSARDQIDDPPGDFLLLSSLTFDSSAVGLFWTTLRGGTLHLLPASLKGDARAIGREVSRCRISHLLCLPSLYELILDEAAPGQLSSLRTVIVAGEACPPELVRRHAALVPQARLFNEGGATEATVFSTVACLASPADGEAPGPCPSGLVSYGRPIANTQVYVLDCCGQPSPVGVPGELFIGGAGVARGYLRRTGLTAERFVPDPFARVPGSRLYRTGDRVRWRPDGHLEILGRLDNQVKVRGYRVEPEGIEAVLDQHPGVMRSAVLAEQESGGRTMLVAFAVGRDGTLTAALLRDYLRGRLPAFLVPSHFAILDELPLNSNGKVDRSALAALRTRAPAEERECAPPRDPVEEILCGAWREVLKQDRVGIRDGFFDLGGHSLLAVQLAGRIRRDFQVELPLATLFSATTIEDQAREVFQALLEQAGDGVLSQLLTEVDGSAGPVAHASSDGLIAPPAPEARAAGSGDVTNKPSEMCQT